MPNANGPAIHPSIRATWKTKRSSCGANFPFVHSIPQSLGWFSLEWYFAHFCRFSPSFHSSFDVCVSLSLFLSFTQNHNRSDLAYVMYSSCRMLQFALIWYRFNHTRINCVTHSYVQHYSFSVRFILNMFAFRIWHSSVFVSFNKYAVNKWTWQWHRLSAISNSRLWEKTTSVTCDGVAVTPSLGAVPFSSYEISKRDLDSKTTCVL